MADEKPVKGDKTAAAGAVHGGAPAPAAPAPKRKKRSVFGKGSIAALERSRQVFEVECPDLGGEDELFVFRVREPAIADLTEMLDRFAKVMKDIQNMSDLDIEKPKEAMRMMGQLTAELLVDEDGKNFLDAEQGAELYFLDGAMPLRVEIMRLMSKVQSGWSVPTDSRGRPVFQVPEAASGGSASGSVSSSELPTPTG